MKTFERYQCMFAEERIEFDWDYFVGFLFFEILYIKEITAYDYCTPYFPQLISVCISQSCFSGWENEILQKYPSKTQERI